MSDEAWAELEQKAPAFAKRLAEEREQRDPASAKRLAEAQEPRHAREKERQRQEEKRLIEQSTRRALSSAGIPSTTDNIFRYQGMSANEILDAIAEESTRSALHSVGIPSTKANIFRWQGMPGNKILDAIDRGFPDAKMYRLNSSINADYAEIKLLSSDEAKLARTGISLKLARRLAKLESPIKTVLDWLGRGFSGSELIEWERAGVVAFVAIDWRSAGFTASESEAWRAEGFTDPHLARRWLETGVDAKVAARRAASGIRPPESSPVNESK